MTGKHIGKLLAGMGVFLAVLFVIAKGFLSVPDSAQIPSAAQGQNKLPPELPPEVQSAGVPQFSTVILSDLHVNADGSENSGRLQRALADLLNMPLKPASILISGDLTDYGREKDYRELQNVLVGYQLPPIHANMGNHDYYSIWFDQKGEFKREAMPNGKTDEQSRIAFQSFMKQDTPYSDAWINGFHFILLSQESYLQERPEVGEGAWYSDRQMDWLKAKLAESDPGKPVFIFIHQPLPPPGQNGCTHQMIRAEEFRQLLKPYRNAFVFSGHTHQDFTNGSPHYVKETFHWIKNSSVSRVLNRNYQGVQRDTSQGLYMYVYPDKVILRGRDFSTQTWIDDANWTIGLF